MKTKNLAKLSEAVKRAVQKYGAPSTYTYALEEENAYVERLPSSFALDFSNVPLLVDWLKRFSEKLRKSKLSKEECHALHSEVLALLIGASVFDEGSNRHLFERDGHVYALRVVSSSSQLFLNNSLNKIFHPLCCLWEIPLIFLVFQYELTDYELLFNEFYKMRANIAAIKFRLSHHHPSSKKVYVRRKVAFSFKRANQEKMRRLLEDINAVLAYYGLDVEAYLNAFADLLLDEAKD